MASNNEVVEVTSKGDPDDIAVVTVRHNWKFWLMVLATGAVGAFVGGLGLALVQVAMASGTC